MLYFSHGKKLTEFLHKLTDQVVKRVNRERTSRPTWGYVPPPEHRLSDQDIRNFVNCVKPAAFHIMWSKFGILDAGFALQNLATLCPDLILPTLVERLTSSLQVVTEPHKLTASLHSMIGVARSLVTYSDAYPEGQAHVLPLLFATLPGSIFFLCYKAIWKKIIKKIFL